MVYAYNTNPNPKGSPTPFTLDSEFSVILFTTKEYENTVAQKDIIMSATGVKLKSKDQLFFDEAVSKFIDNKKLQKYTKDNKLKNIKQLTNFSNTNVLVVDIDQVMEPLINPMYKHQIVEFSIVPLKHFVGIINIGTQDAELEDWVVVSDDIQPYIDQLGIQSEVITEEFACIYAESKQHVQQKIKWKSISKIFDTLNTGNTVIHYKNYIDMIYESYNKMDQTMFDNIARMLKSEDVADIELAYEIIPNFNRTDEQSIEKLSELYLFHIKQPAHIDKIKTNTSLMEFSYYIERFVFNKKDK